MKTHKHYDIVLAYLGSAKTSNFALDAKGTIYQALGRTSDGMARYWQRIDRPKLKIG